MTKMLKGVLSGKYYLAQTTVPWHLEQMCYIF